VERQLTATIGDLHPRNINSHLYELDERYEYLLGLLIVTIYRD